MKPQQLFVRWLSVRFLAIWVIETVAFFLLAYLIKGFTIDNWRTAVVVAAITALLNTLLWPLLSYLLLPATVLAPRLKNGQTEDRQLPAWQDVPRPYIYLPQLMAPRMLAQQHQSPGFWQRPRHFFASIYHNALFFEVLALRPLPGHARDGEGTGEVTGDAGASGRFITLLSELEHAGQTILTPDFAAEMPLATADGHAREWGSSQLEMLQVLTNRELEVLVSLAQRLTNKEIAEKLGISVATVKRHNVNIYEKMGVGNRRQATIEAHKLGLLPLF